MNAGPGFSLHEELQWRARYSFEWSWTPFEVLISNRTNISIRKLSTQRQEQTWYIDLFDIQVYFFQNSYPIKIWKLTNIQWKILKCNGYFITKSWTQSSIMYSYPKEIMWWRNIDSSRTAVFTNQSSIFMIAVSYL